MEQYSWLGLIQIDDGRTDRPTSLAMKIVEEEAELSRWRLIGEAVHLCQFISAGKKIFESLQDKYQGITMMPLDTPVLDLAASILQI